MASTLLILSCQDLLIIMATPALLLASVRGVRCYQGEAMLVLEVFCDGVFVCAIKVCVCHCVHGCFCDFLFKMAMAWLYRASLQCVKLVFDDLWMNLVISFMCDSLDPFVAGEMLRLSFGK